MIVSAKLPMILIAVALAARGIAAADPPVHGTWRATPIASIAERIGAIAGMPVVVDHRLDSTKRIDIDGGGRPVESVLGEIADAAEGEVASLGLSYRITPKGLAKRVSAADAARASRIASLPAAARESIERELAWRWEAGVTPRELVERLADEASIPIGPLDAIPHDHLPARSLPPLPLADRLDLVLADYDLRIEAGPRGRKGLSIVPLGEAVDGRQRQRPAIQSAGKPKPALVDSFTLRAEAPLEQLLQTIATKFGLTLDLDAAALAAKGVAAGEIVRVAVEDAPRNQVLDAITKPLGLSWNIDGTTLEVR